MTATSEILVPVGVGELLDKLTILEIKAERITDPDKLTHIEHERTLLQSIADQHIPPSDDLNTLTSQLKQTNEKLWEIEDRIRDLEREQNFGEEFIEVARAVYHTNDERCRLKREINDLTGSGIIEEKSYREYDPPE